MLSVSCRGALVSDSQDFWNSFEHHDGQTPSATTILSRVPNYDFPHVYVATLMSFLQQRLSPSRSGAFLSGELRKLSPKRLPNFIFFFQFLPHIAPFSYSWLFET